jgi:long-subunit acyl-CoA synthetase (AMP-forming)
MKMESKSISREASHESKLAPEALATIVWTSGSPIAG